MEKGALIGSGRTADVYEWGNDRILKLYQEGMPAVAIEREFATTRLAGGTGLAVPAVEEMLEVNGRLGIVFERIRGPSMLKVLEERPWEILSISRLLAELHARMHTCHLPPGTNSLYEQIERGIGWANDLTDPEKQTIQTVLANLPTGNALCHGDFHPDNILLSDHGPVIIDWMTATRGHPPGDVARTSLLIKTGGLPPRLTLLLSMLINGSRRFMISTYLKRYQQIQPVSRREIDEWTLPLLAARLFEVEAYPLEKKLILKRIRGTLVGLGAG
jgi:Ser/Thr protein kinase RdoA (MazF antagonist)